MYNRLRQKKKETENNIINAKVIIFLYIITYPVVPVLICLQQSIVYHIFIFLVLQIIINNL